MGDKTSKGAALITGASSGIGAVYADRLARRGYDLILAARDEARLNALAAKLRAETGVKVDVIRADLTDKTDLASLTTRLRNDEGIALLLNNAGVAQPAEPFTESDFAKLDNLIQLNVTAVTALAQAAAAAFAGRGHGTIVNLGSVVGLIPEAFAGSAVYGATKAFVLYLTEALNQDLASKGVVFQAVLPGATRTEIWERSGYGIDNVPEQFLMHVDELVDAALAGLDRGELVTIPSLPDPAEWAAVGAARLKLGPNLSHNHPAPRYGVAAVEPA